MAAQGDGNFHCICHSVHLGRFELPVAIRLAKHDAHIHVTTKGVSRVKAFLLVVDDESNFQKQKAKSRTVNWLIARSPSPRPRRTLNPLSKWVVQS